MPFYVICRPRMVRIATEFDLIDYLTKHGTWDPDFRRARIFANMGAVKNSVTHWKAAPRLEDFIQELDLTPTGRTIDLKTITKKPAGSL